MINKTLENGWATIDEAQDFFLNLVLELQALKRLPSPPTDLFLSIETGDNMLDSKVLDTDPRIVLCNLD